MLLWTEAVKNYRLQTGYYEELFKASDAAERVGRAFAYWQC
jgi:hypothetical protein